ncbi:MAG TPA: PAS domain S-box protein [Candidatus Sulfotelmatobacter sp.]|nr:PAS domain S-box protein [Candidatus Sulfotelmatobacter sp.]
MDTGNSSRVVFPPENPDAPTLAQDQLHAAILAWTLELAPHGLFTTDTELKITSWNQWLETHARKNAAEVLGKPLVEVIPSLLERRLDHYYRDALQGESKLLSRSLHGYLLPLLPTVPTPQFAHMQQSARIAPLLLQGRIAGTITVIEDVTEREWQHAVLRQARQRSELLASTLAHLISARDPEQLVSQIFARIATPLRLDCCIHHVLEPPSQRIQLLSATGLSSAEQHQCALLQLGQGLCGTVLQTRKRLVINHLQTQGQPNLEPCKGFGLCAFAGFPLLINQRLLGSLAFGTRSHDSIPEEDVQFLFTLSQYAAIALDRAQQENKLRASEERFRDMADTVPGIIFTTAADGSWDYVNSRFYELTGLPPASGLGLGWRQAIHPADVPAVQGAWQRCAETGELYSVEFRLRDKQGQYRWLYARARSILDETNHITKWFGAITDIQELKQAHEELAQAQAELAQHAASLEKTVQERTRELRETISQLESFSYTVAHDLRAPIRTFENYAKILLEDYGARLDAQAQTLLVNMARAARRLDALTRDVLNYTKVATQKAELAPVDPAEILQDVLVMNPALQTPNAEVAVAQPLPRVLAHPTLLSQCFSNLLSNAVKFVKPGLTPHIVIRSETRTGPAPARAATNLLRPHFGTHFALPPAAPESGPAAPSSPLRVRLWVQDNGIGLDPEAQTKVFGIFERGRGASRIPGTGIGLAIVAKAVERMEGAYGVESNPGEGSRFWIELLAA